MVRKNHCELNKIAFANWVEKALNTSLSKKLLRVELGLWAYGHSIPRPWMKRVDQMKFTEQ
jgi:hypothetical protein